MTAGPPQPLRVALLRSAGGEGAEADAVAAALRGAGHAPSLVVARPVAGVEEALRRRGFTEGLTTVPPLLWALARGTFDVAHAFTPPAALSALAWRRLTGRPVVFTCGETPARARLADRRLRLRLLAPAVEATDAVVVADEPARSALWRWMAADAQVLAPDDAGGHVRLYRDVLGQG